MIEELIVEKKVKKNSACMDIEGGENAEDLLNNDEGITDELKKAIMTESKNHNRLMELKKQKEDELIHKVVKKKYKKKQTKHKKNPNKPKGLRDMEKNQKVLVEYV